MDILSQSIHVIVRRHACGKFEKLILEDDLLAIRAEEYFTADSPAHLELKARTVRPLERQVAGVHSRHPIASRQRREVGGQNVLCEILGYDISWHDLHTQSLLGLILHCESQSGNIIAVDVASWTGKIEIRSETLFDIDNVGRCVAGAHILCVGRSRVVDVGNQSRSSID